jgi:1,4-dihydroxy-2-naphthoyl-CoA hydrolase
LENSIWFNKSVELSMLHAIMPGTMGAHLQMETVELGPDFLTIRMPVDHRTHQPYGLLHGGASCALAETVGSIASHLVIDFEKFNCVGIEINANHVRGIKSGWVYGKAIPLHLGNSTHVWDIKITDESDRLICVSRLTVAILPKK